VTTFEPLSRRVAPGIREEARDLGRFLEVPQVGIEFR
jgi:hypothetical protein